MTPLQRAKDVQEARANNAALKLTARMIQDDAWAEGAGWSGPMPQPDKDGANDQALLMAQVRREFVSRNPLDNVVTRHVHGIAGREPSRAFTVARPLKDGEAPTREEQRRLNEYRDAFDDWWTNSGAFLAIQKALHTALWSEKGTVRLFIPRSKLEELPATDGHARRGVPAGLTLPQAMGYVSVAAPAWDAAGIVRDTDDRVQLGYYTYTDEQKRSCWEIHERGTFKDAQGRPFKGTKVTPAATGAESDPGDVYPVPDLMLFEVRLTPLVRESLRSLVKFGNKTLTMGSRNINLGGFVETTILNAQMPGEWVKDESAPGGRRFVKAAYHKGAGTATFLTGVAVMQPDPQNSARMVPTGQIATPSINHKDPVSWVTFGDTWAAIREAIYEEAKQLHVLISGDATASGVSRVQAVQDFLTSLDATAAALEQLTRWLMTTVTRLALYLAGRGEEWTGHAVTARARRSVVQPTPDQIRAANEMRDKRRISYKMWAALVGIDEPDEEQAALSSERITQDLALILVDKLPTWLGLRAMQQAFPTLNITDEDIDAQREIDLAAPQSAGPQPADLTDDDLSAGSED